MKRYRVPRRSTLYFYTVLVPVFVMLVVQQLVRGQTVGLLLMAAAVHTLVTGYLRQYGSRLWMLAALPLGILGVVFVRGGLPEDVHRGLVFAALATVAASYPFWVIVGPGLSPLLDAREEGITIRGGERHSWAEVEGIDADPDALRIRFVDGTKTLITSMELPLRKGPEKVRSHIDGFLSRARHERLREEELE